MKRVAVTGFWAECYGGNERGRRWDVQVNSWEGCEFPYLLSTPTLLGDYKTVRRGLIEAQLLSKQGELLVNPERTAVSVGSSKGDFTLWPELGAASESFPPFADHIALRMAEFVQATGPRLSPVAACAGGTHALALGAQLIEDGYADVALCGAYEPQQNEFLLGGYRSLGALSKSGVMRPFDQNRDGFVPSWGGGYVFLESEEHARARGAAIYGFLAGYSLKCDATHMTAMCPSGDSIARAIEESLGRAGNPRIDYINAHGTATKLNDATESRGIELSLGRSVPTSSTKPLTGHLLGAAGAVEAVICLLAMRQNFAPPTLNLETPDETLHLDSLLRDGRALELNTVLSLNYGFGGHIGALVFQKQ